MKTLILVRHGTTEWVEKHILHGITDIPLNALGLQQAEEVAEALKGVPAAQLYSSPLSRSLQTAIAIAARVNREPILLDGLKELNFGWLEGRSFIDLTTRKVNPAVMLVDHQWRAFLRSVTGETIFHFHRRVLKAWQSILDENQNDISIVVAHSAVLNQILIHHLGRNFPSGMPYYSLRPCSISEIHIHPDGRAEKVRLDDASHLSAYKTDAH